MIEDSVCVNMSHGCVVNLLEVTTLCMKVS